MPTSTRGSVFSAKRGDIQGCKPSIAAYMHPDVGVCTPTYASCMQLAIHFHQSLDTLLRQRLQAFAARRQMLGDLLAHARLPEPYQMVGHTRRTRSLVRIRFEIAADVVGHRNQAFDVHTVVPAACSKRCG